MVCQRSRNQQGWRRLEHSHGIDRVHSCLRRVDACKRFMVKRTGQMHRDANFKRLFSLAAQVWRQNSTPPRARTSCGLLLRFSGSLK
jgi:hypothetical protein